MNTIESYFKKYCTLYCFEEGPAKYLIDDDDFKEAVKEYTGDLLQEYTERIINNVRLKKQKVLFDDPKEGDDAYMNISVVDEDSIKE